jgi:hypothetical protein
MCYYIGTDLRLLVAAIMVDLNNFGPWQQLGQGNNPIQSSKGIFSGSIHFKH